jgi:hypothetical protein
VAVESGAGSLALVADVETVLVRVSGRVTVGVVWVGVVSLKLSLTITLLRPALRE